MSALKELGYAVDVAPDGVTGVAKILANRPDLVLCDSSVLRTSGLELCLDLLEQLAEASPLYAAVPLILLTPRPSRKSELADRGLPADDCLTKPIDPERLRVVVEKRLGRADARARASARKRLPGGRLSAIRWPRSRRAS